jgi:hypothetical protein
MNLQNSYPEFDPASPSLRNFLITNAPLQRIVVETHAVFKQYAARYCVQFNILPSNMQEQTL